MIKPGHKSGEGYSHAFGHGVKNAAYEEQKRDCQKKDNAQRPFKEL
jgi:hypothetical protein